SLLHPDDLNTVKKQFETLFNGKKISIEYRYKKKNGAYIDLFTNAVPLQDGKSTIMGALGVARDITQKIKYENQVKQVQKMEAVGMLAGGIAHDFNNILGVITGNISHALTSIKKDEELFDVLSDVQQGAMQAQQLTQQLLTFSIGGEPIKKEVDLNRLITESATFNTRGSKTRCEFNITHDLWTVKIDKGQMNQVFGNLIINATQAMPSGGIITLQTENIETGQDHTLPLLGKHYVKLSIADQGIGISEKNMSRIFDPFFTTKQKGSGLGLATTYSIIKKHGGHITVHSKMDKGTTFHIYLPAFSKNVIKEEISTDVLHHGHGKILILDDQEPILKMVGRMLNRMGYEAVFATDGSLAIEIFRDACRSNKPFQLVILDLTIPGGMGGADTIKELLKIDPNIKAVVSSGYSNDPIMANYQDYGFSGVVPKPYTKNQITELLKTFFS
ncbi:MAG: response regulator, partial [Candidatus Magnetomorum sp.]|nr:response regulator [Candidatus Magnetomorum sp.]